jgi:hypothetical protein
MTLLFIRRLMTIVVITLLSVFTYAQTGPGIQAENVRITKPYKILTSGKQITVKSTKDIKSIMVWTASGHRIVEDKEVNSTSFSFNINVSEKVFFVMIQFEGSKPYTEKIGVQ